MGKRSSPCLSNRAKKLARGAWKLGVNEVRLSHFRLACCNSFSSFFFFSLAEKEGLLVAAIQLHKAFILLGVTAV